MNTYGCVTQLAEYPALTRKVGGSKPSTPTKHGDNMAKRNLKQIARNVARKQALAGEEIDPKPVSNRRRQGDEARRRVLEHLQAGKDLDRLSGWHELGLLDITPRIKELEDAGYDIKRKNVPIVNLFGEEKQIRTFYMEVEED